MDQIGVRVEVADAKEKSLPASLRSAQDASRWLLRRHDGNDRSLAGSIQDLCRYAQVDHDFRVRGGFRGVNSREVEHRIQDWMALPTQVPMPTVTGGLDWEPGPWLSSWETSLPPEQPRYFNFDGFDGSVWLLTGENAQEDIVEDDGYWADAIMTRGRDRQESRGVPGQIHLPRLPSVQGAPCGNSMFTSGRRP